MRGLVAACALAALCSVAHAEAETQVLGAGSYGQYLVDQAKARNANIDSITLFASLGKEQGTISVASNSGATGQKPQGAAAATLKSGHPIFTFDRVVRRLLAAMPLYDMQRKPAGILVLRLKAEPGQNQSVLSREAVVIRDTLARRISYAANLVQLAHLDPKVPMHSYAQHLVDEGLLRHPDVLILAIHASTPKNADAEILASNIGRIGKKADDDDMRVVRDGKTNLEVNKELVRYEVELPLNDVSGSRIGALGVVFPLTPNLDQNAKHQEAIQIRDEISRRILTAANLVEPYPFDPNWSDNTMAQRLVDKTLTRHPDILVLALHVTPPAGGKNIILASNIGRVGKIADDDDMGVVQTGKPAMAVNAEGNRYEVELALDDRAGKKIGAVSVVYAYKNGDDKSALARKAQGIAHDLSRRIPNAAALFGQAS